MNSITKRGTANVLRKAAKTIERYGWLKGSYGSPSTGFCAAGAIKWVGQRSESSAALGACRNVLGVSVLSKWNDKTASCPAEVTKLFRKTARLLEHGMELPKV